MVQIGDCKNGETGSLREFYQDAVVLVSGGTGFLGKLLLEKLLRGFPDIGRIYVLVRRKHGQSAEERIKLILEQEVFKRAKAEVPGCMAKIIGISGDLTMPRMGLSPEVELIIIKEVSIIFHVAATVKFTEPMRAAVEINIRGTHTLLELAHEMPLIKAVVHVSTAYSNCTLKHVKEIVYEPPMTHERLYKLIACLDDPALARINSSLLADWPNTYTFTKCIAEHLVQEKHNFGLPVGIFRPSIVISTYDEPFSGWADNYTGPVGCIVGAFRGYIRCMPGRRKVRPNLVPADLTTNILIASAWDIHTRFKAKEVKTPVYNFVGQENLTDWYYYCSDICPQGLTHPYEDAIWYYTLKVYETEWGFKTAILLKHILPALLIDGFLLVTGKKPKLLKAYNKIHKTISMVKYFGVNNWTFETQNCDRLWQILNDDERRLLPFSMKDFDWIKYGKNFIPGIQKYVVKQSRSSLEKAKAKSVRLYYLHRVFKALYYMLATIGLWKILIRRLLDMYYKRNS